MTARASIRVWGLGHVGLVTAAGLLERGRDVIAIDRDCNVTARIRRDGGAPDSPHSLKSVIATGLESGRLVIDSAADARLNSDVDVICVNAPSDQAGKQSVKAVLDVLERIDSLRQGREPQLIIVRTTVVPGTCDRTLIAYLEEQARKSGRSVPALVMHPAFVRRCDFERDWHERVVVGVAEPSAAATFARAFALDPRSLTCVDRTSAELVKYADNAFHATKVSFANECARVASAIGVDPAAILGIVASDPVLNASAAYLSPGAPYAGPCLPKDMRTLVRFAASLGVEAPLLQGAELSNSLHSVSPELAIARFSAGF